MEKPRKNAIKLAGHWAVGALFYWWLVAKTQSQQLAAAVIVGGIVAAALLAVEKRAKISFAVEWEWFGLLLRRLPFKVVRDIGLLAGALLSSVFRGSRPTGVFRAKPFVPGGADAKSAARRALVLTSVSLPPNTLAVAVQEDSTLQIHQLVFQSEPENERWPI